MMKRFQILPVASIIGYQLINPVSVEAQKEKPNIVLFLADDMGYSDIGCYGGEIQTPNLDKLAKQGVRFTSFYNCARCCPTRASLLTGQYAQQVGLANNGNTLYRNAATIAEVLKEAGYHTGMSGKWHLSKTAVLPNPEDQLLWLSHRNDSSVFAPLESYPCNRGFEEHWGVIWGVVDYFDPFSLVHNETAIKDVPRDFYMTDFITDKSVEMIGQFSKDDKPFFLYIAYTSPHWPLHARPEDIEKYKGKYDEGWDVLREKRYRKAIELGIIDEKTAPLSKNESGKLWVDCTEKEWEAKHMEAHAAMVDRMDQGIGKVIEKLKATGEYMNTIIFFLADNGASPERGFKPGFDRPGQTRSGEEILYPHQKYDRPGAEKTWGYLGDAWAGAINSPFRYWKVQSFEGGICTPLIVQWPKGLKGKENTLNHGVGHVMDILPTCLELANAKYPEQINGETTFGPTGKSILPILFKGAKSTNDTLFWEHQGGRAARLGDWKIVALKNKDWELFNLAEDRTETNNLAAKYPEKVEQLNALWMSWSKRVNK
ncbi:MAG: arylsulfatase [Bacteroidia bacterium]|nr:arylsulfatase [Bacteroidia bacterium]